MRGAESLAAVRATGGAVVRVAEQEIEQARERLARCGFYVEATSAVAVAALAGLRETLASAEVAVVPLTGHGLKTYGG